MSTITITDGQDVVKDPNEVKVYTFDWGTDNLATGVTIASMTITVTALYPAGDTSLTASTASPLGIQSGSRTVKAQLSAGTLGARYQVTNQIITSETPAQTKEKSFYVQMQDS